MAADDSNAYVNDVFLKTTNFKEETYVLASPSYKTPATDMSWGIKTPFSRLMYLRRHCQVYEHNDVVWAGSNANTYLI